MNGNYGAKVGRNVRWPYLRLASESAAEIVAARILLSALGVEGYGLFAAVAGSIGAIGFCQGSLEAAARRFVCCDSDNFAPLFGLTLVLAGLMGLVGGVVAFVAVPSAAAGALFVLGVSVVRLLRIPYETCVVADERMGFFFFVSLVESALALAAAVLAGRLPLEPVATYAGLRFASFALTGGLVVAYCLVRHPLSRTRPQFRLGAGRALLGFFGWQALGSVAGLLKGNGLIVLLAAYAGATGCAACAAAGRVTVLLWGLIANYRMAYLPGVVKAWTAGDRTAFVAGTRRAFGWSLDGMTLVVAPIFVFAPEICRACIGESVPEEAAMFLRMVALQLFFEALATPFDTAILAAGRIARYEILLTALLGTSFFLAWIFQAAGLPAWTTTGAVALVNGIAFIFRLAYVRRVRMPDGTRAW